MKRRLALACAAALLCSQAWAEGTTAKDFVPQRDIPETVKIPPRDETPLVLRLLMKPIKRGMWIRLPVVDTDPNRGVTAGVMPIWVIKENGSDRIQHIHAPSLTYNRHFGVIPTYRYYMYPADDSTLTTRAAVGKYEHEILVQYEDMSFHNTEFDVFGRVQWNADSGQRYYGVGPDTPKTAETNFKEDYIQTCFVFGIPLRPGSKWRVHLADRIISSKVANGPMKGLPGFEDTYPEVVPRHHRQSHEMRFSVDYDSRDHGVTTRKGGLMSAFGEYSVQGFASQYDFNRYGFDGRYFLPVPGHEDRSVTGAQLKLEQVYGRAPFWLLPRIGGKYALRAYGDGRYIDRGMAVFNLEQRFKVYQVRLSGVVTEFEAAPFVGMGTVFDTPDRMSKRYARPVVGVATRAVARPQVVGSVDIGVGQEGLALFMDINYSF